MSWFSLNPKKTKTAAIIDIGSSSVGAALIEYAPHSKNICPTIIYSIRKEIIFDESLDFKRFITALSNTLATIVETIHQKAAGPIDHYHCSLPSPLYLSQTKNIRYGEPKPFTVTSALLKDLTTKTAASFAQNNHGLYPELQNDQTFILESTVMQTRLNGYVTEKPEQKQAQTMSLAHHVSLTSTAVRQKMAEMITKYDRRATVNFHSYAFEIFSTLRDIVAETSFIVIDISGELTDIFLVTEDVLFGAASFPLGRNFIIRSIASSLNTVYAEAESTLNLYTEGKTNPTTTATLTTKLTEIRAEWMNQLKETLGKFQESSLLPELIFLIGNDGTTNLVSTWITGDHTITDFTLSNKSFAVRTINPEMIKGFCNGLSVHQKDVPLLLESIFYAKISQTN